MAITGTNKQSAQTAWSYIGNITSEQAALAVTARDNASVEALADAKVIKIRPAGNPYAMSLRFRADGNADLDSVLELYAARGEDFYKRIATLTITTGTQDTGTSTIHFIDTIVATNEETLLDGEEGICTANEIAEYYIRTFGFDRFALIASDLDSTTIYCDIAYLGE